MISFLDSAQLLNSIQRKSLLDIYLKSAYTTEKKRVRTVKEGVRFVRFMRSDMCTDSFFFFCFSFFWAGWGGGGFAFLVCDHRSLWTTFLIAVSEIISRADGQLAK